VTATHADGDRIDTVPAEVARIAGPARAVLAGERTALTCSAAVRDRYAGGALRG